VIDADVAAAASALVTASRSTLFTVMLSAFYVLADKITGSTDLAIRAFTAGRAELEFQNTMGLFLNCVPFRTEIADCTSFRDIVAHTRETFIDAMAHELPVNVIEQTFPEFLESREDLRTSQFIISDTPAGDDEVTHTIAESAHAVSGELSQGAGHHDIPSGTVWNLSVEPSGELHGGVLFNLDEFDESTVQGWTADLRRILTAAVRDPDQDWRLL
jgi:non-ribosomal peptide synthetase component F